MTIRWDLTPERVAGMYATGASAFEVAVALNCSEGLVYRRLDAAGVQRRSRGERRCLSTEDAKRMHDDGMSVKEISDKAGCSTSVVHDRLHEAGVKSGKSPLRPDQLDPDQAPSHLARLLLQYRKAHDLTQTTLANRIGCTRNYLSMLESGARGKHPPMRMLRAIASVLQVDEYELMPDPDDQGPAAGCGKQHVRKVLSDAGVEIRTRWWKSTAPGHPWKDPAREHRQPHDEQDQTA